MGYTKATFLARSSGWPDGAYDISNWYGSLYEIINCSYRGRTLQDMQDQPDRYAAIFIHQNLLTWLQAIGTDSAIIHYSYANWFDYPNSVGSSSNNYNVHRGTAWEFLGPDYLTGKKDMNSSHRTLWSIDSKAYSANTLRIDHSNDMNWNYNPASSNGMSQLINSTENAYHTFGTDYYNTYRTNILFLFARYYDWRCVYDDTPGNEYFYLLFRRSRLFTKPITTSTPQDERDRFWNYGARGAKSVDNWQVKWGFGRIQDRQEVPETKGTDTGWYVIYKPGQTDNLHPYPYLKAIGDQTLGKVALYDYNPYRDQDVAAPDGIYPDFTKLAPSNTDYNPNRVYQFQDPYWSKEAIAQVDEGYYKSAHDTIPQSTTPEGRSAFAYGIDSSYYFSQVGLRGANRQVFSRLPLYSNQENLIGHTGSNIMVAGPWIVQSLRSGEANTFVKDNYIWDNMGGFMFNTRERPQ